MNRTETLAEIKGYSAFWLSGSDLADCQFPDLSDSPGGLLLTHTRDAFLSWMQGNPEATRDDILDACGQIIDDMVSIYTHERWQQFVDLGAYNEESESGEWPDDLTEAAAVALYQILDRMVGAFAEMIDEAEEEPEEDDEEA